MADKINWLPAAIGAAVVAGLVAVRVPNAGRNTLGAAALIGGAVGYGAADFLEDRSPFRVLGRAGKGITDAIGGVGKTIGGALTGAAGKATGALTGVARGGASGVRSAWEAAKSSPGRAKKAGSAAKKWLKRRF